jgi:magnesium-transporting ATPase (P-type)
MAVVWLGAAASTLVTVGTPTLFNIQLTFWLWFTLVFANFAEAVAEGRGKAQADSLRKLRTTTQVRKLNKDGMESLVSATELRKGDRVVCKTGDLIPADGDVVEGVAQTIARGPVAAFVSIKQLGTNGGGFFGPNSTHPFENPTFIANAVSMMALILLPMACVWMFGRITGRMKDAAVLFAVMLVLLLGKTDGLCIGKASRRRLLQDCPLNRHRATWKARNCAWVPPPAPSGPC